MRFFLIFVENINKMITNMLLVVGLFTGLGLILTKVKSAKGLIISLILFIALFVYISSNYFVN